MGLRDFMLGVEQFKSGMSDLEKAKRMEEIRNAQEGVVNDIRTQYGEEKAKAYSNAVQSGDKLLQAHMLNQLFPSSSQSGGLITDAAAAKIAAPGATDEEIATIIGAKDAKQQAAILGGVKTKYNQAQITGRQQTQLASTEQERGQKQSTKAFDVINKTKDAFREEESTIEMVKKAMQNKNAVDDAIVFNFVARNVTKEKGPLSDNDIQRLQGIIGVQATGAELASYFSGKNYTRLSEEQRKAVRDVVNRASEQFQSRRATAYAQDLSDLYNSQAKLKDKNGNPTGILKSTLEEAKSQGVPIEFDPKEKAFVVKKSIGQGVGEVEASLLREAASTGDKNLMSSIGSALSIMKKSGKQMTPEQEQNLRNLIQSRKGAANGQGR